MSHLKFKIGGMDVNPDFLVLGPRGINPLHRFLVREEGDIFSIYIAHLFSVQLPKGWPDGWIYCVLAKFGFEPNDKSIVGWGKLFMRENGQLVFIDGVIPNQVAQEFGKLLLPELKKMGLEIKEISAEINEIFLSGYWTRLGFEQKITPPLVLKV